jgi:FlaA1/EpsC-like NDP-sugar epimerase
MPSESEIRNDGTLLTEHTCILRGALEKNNAPLNMEPLSGKIAIVTGGTRGIGRAIAERLLREEEDDLATDEHE